MMLSKALIASLLLSVSASGVLWFMWRLADTKFENVMEQLEIAQFQIDTCRERIKTLAEDAADDRKIDNLSDDDLRNVPDFWLLPSQPE